MQYPDPTSDDQQDFLVRLYFGQSADKLKLCLDRAYLDFNRTLHGIGEAPDSRRIASSVLHQEISGLITTIPKIDQQQAFDAWHERVCRLLQETYAAAGYTRFTIGQAQKWINMTLKYAFVMEEKRIAGLLPIYRFCHVPIDNILLAKLAPMKPPKPTAAWSRLSTYSEYLAFQLWFRQAFNGTSPLAVEFHIWQSP